jgi:hypothetical protein
MEANFRTTLAELRKRLTREEVELFNMVLPDRLRRVSVFDSDTPELTELYMTMCGALGTARAGYLLTHK